jgi:hypothetical protein
MKIGGDYAQEISLYVNTFTKFFMVPVFGITDIIQIILASLTSRTGHLSQNGRYACHNNAER